MFIDTANVRKIKTLLETGVFEGVTTNPTLLVKEKNGRFQQLKKIAVLNPYLTYIQLQGSDRDELMADYKEVFSFFEDGKVKYGLKIPINTEGLAAIKKIREENPTISILGTAVYSAEQAILSGLAGCQYVAPYIKRMENAGIDPYSLIETTRKYFDREQLSCKIMAASFKDSSQVIQSLDAGAHTATVSPLIFQEMAEKEVAKKAIDVFNDHGKELEGFQ